MKYGLLITLSFLGLFMAIASALFLPFGLELAGWLVVFLISGFVIAKNTDEQYVINGIFAGLLMSVWYFLADYLLYKHFYINRRNEITTMENMGITGSIRITMFILYPVIGLIAGYIIGVLAFIFSRFLKTQRA